MEKIENLHLTTFLLTITLLILLLAGLILTILFLYRRKHLDHIKSIEKIKSEFENNLLNTQLEIQEQTLENISREIHDNIVLTLTLAKLNLIATVEKLTSANKDLTDNTITLISKAIYDLADISKSMNSDTLEHVGLIAAVEKDLSRINKANIFNVELLVDGTPEYFEAKVDLLLYRIIQESLNNIIKHAFATHVSIKLRYQPDYFSVTVKDNGKGFSHKDNITMPGTGLKNMRTRAKTLNGDLNIDSKEGEGTTINVKIPISKWKEQKI